MKKLFLVFALGLGLTAFAQENKSHHDKGKHKGKHKQDMEQMKKMTPEERHKAHMDKLSSELSLDASQQEQVGKIMSDRNAKLRDMKAQMEALKKQMITVNKDTKDQMKTALKPEQYTKWMQLREETMNMMMEDDKK